MFKENFPPEKGESLGPMMVAYQFNRSSSLTGPAEQFLGGFSSKSTSSL